MFNVISRKFVTNVSGEEVDTTEESAIEALNRYGIEYAMKHYYYVVETEDLSKEYYESVSKRQ